MALNTMKVMRSLVRQFIGEPIQDKFQDPEIDMIINFGCLAVAKRLRSIDQELFAKRSSITRQVGGGEYDTATLPSDCLKIESLTTNADKRFQRLPVSAFGLIASNKCYTPSATNPYYILIGSTLYLWGGSGSVYLHYIRKPTEMTGDDDTTIIPVEFTDAVIAYAVWKCAAKAGLNPAQKEKEYDEMFKEFEETHRRDIKVKVPGDMKEG